MKAHYISTLDHRAVQRANGTFRVQKLNTLLVDDRGKASRDRDPWEDISPKLSQAEALAMLRRFELDPQIKRFVDNQGRAI